MLRVFILSTMDELSQRQRRFDRLRLINVNATELSLHDSVAAPARESDPLASADSADPASSSASAASEPWRAARAEPRPRPLLRLMIGAPREGFQRPRLHFTRSRTDFAAAEQRCLRDLCAVLLCAAMLLQLTRRNDREAPRAAVVSHRL